jgi:predicted transcriptional regulator
MTKTEALEALIERVAAWPPEAQDEFMHSVSQIEEKHVGVYRLNAEEQAAIEAAIVQADRGEFASDQEMAELWRRHGL